jgi:hypothetical protein
LGIGLFQLNESAMDKIPRARVNPRTLVKNTVHGRSADAGRFCYFVNSGSRLSPHRHRKSDYSQLFAS